MGAEQMGKMLGPVANNETLQPPPKAALALAASSPSTLSTTLTDYITGGPLLGGQVKLLVCRSMKALF